MITQNRLVLLDGMRGLAAFAVIVDHVPSETLRALLPGRYLAVDFFFVLSGLVLARAYGRSLADAQGVWRFLKIRFIRLYPLYLLGLILGMLVYVVSAVRGWTDFGPAGFFSSAISGVLFLPNPATLGSSPDLLFPFDPPAWTLFFELIANLLFALTAIHLSNRRLLIGVLVCALWAGWAVISSDALGAGWEWDHFNAGFSRVLFGFFAGVALSRIPSHFGPTKIPHSIPILALVFILAFPAPEPFRRLSDALIMVMLVPVTVFAAARTQTPVPFVGACRWLGKVSYGVYILHVPILQGLEFVTARLDVSVSGVVLTIIVAALSAATTQIAMIVFEAPLQTVLKRRLLAQKNV